MFGKSPPGLASSLWEPMSLSTGRFMSCFLGKAINGYLDYFFLALKESIGRPLLNIDKHKHIPIISPVLKTFRKGFDQVYAPKPKPQPMFPPAIQERVDRYLKAAPNLVKKRWSLAKPLLEGPPGTGKTLVANHIASKLGWSFIKVNGSDLLAMVADPKRSPVSELNKLLTEAKKGFGKTLLFIDEAEIFLQNRDLIDTKDPKGQARYEMLTSFMTFIEDDAFKSKCAVVCGNKP